MFCRILFFVTGISFLIAAGEPKALADVSYAELIRHYAPVIYQGVGSRPRADQITRFDFDGDFIADNNWNHLEVYEEPAYVYYNVTETKTHFYLTYAFFHVRDYKSEYLFCVPDLCHENDFEGANFIVEKDDGPFGHLVGIETLAHDYIDSIENPLVVDEPVSREKHPVLFIEAKGHGVHTWSNQEAFRDYLRKAGPKFVFYFNGVAEDPRGVTAGTFSYDLLSISQELWDRRSLTGPHEMFTDLFDYHGRRFQLESIPSAFAGEKYGHGRARPPWGWIDKSDSYLKRGDWFLDPALSAQRHFKAMSAASSEYVYNSFLSIDLHQRTNGF